MTLQTEEAPKASFRSRHPVVVWACCTLTCFCWWQLASASYKVAGAERQAETGQLANYDQYMWDSAQQGWYFIAADYCLFAFFCLMELGPRLSSRIAPAALFLILTGPPFFYAAWHFYQCQRDLVMEGVAYSCLTLNLPVIDVSYKGLVSFSFKVTCAESYAYVPHPAYTTSARLASGAWSAALTGAGLLFFIAVIVAVFSGLGLLNRAEVPKVPDEEAQELLEEKM